MPISQKMKHNIAMLAVGGVLVFVAMVLIASFWSPARTVSYTWTQNNWGGGTDGGVEPDHTNNQTGWTKYDSKDAGVVVDGSNNIVLDDTGGTTTHTTDADFNSGTATGVSVSSDSVTLGSGTSNAGADTTLDFDAADESNFAEEDSTKTEFSSGVAQLQNQDVNLGKYVDANAAGNNAGLAFFTYSAYESGFPSQALGDEVTDDVTMNLWYKPPSSGTDEIWRTGANSTGETRWDRLKLESNGSLTIYNDGDGATSLGTTDLTPLSDRTKYYFISIQYEYNSGTSRFYLYVDKVQQTFSAANFTASHSNINDGIRTAQYIYSTGDFADMQLWKGLRSTSEQETDRMAYHDGKTYTTLNATASAGQELIYWADFETGITGTTDPFKGRKSGVSWNGTNYNSTVQGTGDQTAPGVIDTSAGYYITTSDSNQINTTNWLDITSVDTTESEPTNSTVRYLVSFDDRSNWSYWTGSAWSTTAIGNVHTTGMTKTVLEAISEAQWGASGGFDVADTDLDFTVGFKTTDPDATSSVDLITVNNTISKSNITLDFDAVDEGNFTEEVVSSNTTVFASGLVQLPERTVDLGNYMLIKTPGGRNDNIPALSGGTSGFTNAAGDAVTEDWTFNFWYHPGTTGAMDMLDVWNSSTAGGAYKLLYLNTDHTIKVYADDGSTVLGTTTTTPISDRGKFYHISLQYEYNFGDSRYYIYVDSVLQPFDNGFNFTNSHANINDGTRVSLDPSGHDTTGSRFADNQLWKGLRSTTEQRTDAQAYADGSSFATHAATASGSQELIYWQDYESATFTGTGSFRGRKSGTTWTVTDYSSGQGNSSTHTAVAQSGIAGYLTTGHYLHTTGTNQIDVSGWVNMEGIAVTGTFATGTITRYLVSYDGRVTWSYWNGSAWATTALANIHTTGMTRGTMEGISQSNWAASGGFDSDSTTTLDVALSLKSTGGVSTPIIDLLTIGYDDVSATSGTLESPTINTGGANNSFGNISWTATNTSVTKIVKFQVAVKSADSGWVSGDYLGPDGTTGTFYTTAAGEAIRAGDDGNQYVRYKATILRDVGDADSASLDDVSLAYSVYSASATFTSSAFDTEASAVALASLGWTEVKPAGTDVQFQIRTAPDSAGSPGTWTNFCGPDDGAGGCSTGTYFTDPAASEAIDADFNDASNDQWIQYKVTLTSDGTATPTVSAVSYGYVINTAPTVSNVTASQDSAGLVTVGYDFADGEEANGTISVYYQLAGVTLNETLTNSDTTAITVSSGTNLPDAGTILIDSEVITYTSKSINDLQGTITRGFGTSKAVAHTSGVAVYVKAATTGGDSGASVTTGTSKSATWTAKTDQDGFYGAAVMRVLADDGNSALQFGATNATSFNLDVKDPTGVSLVIAADQSTANRANLTIAASDDNTVTMNVTNASGYGDDLVNTNAGTYVTYATSKTSWILESDPDTVYMQIKDTKGNITAVSAVTPTKPTNSALAEISNTALDTPTYGMYLTWDVMAAPTPGFTNYKIYRKAGAGAYSAIKTETTRTTNNYADTGLSASTVYTYYITMTDSDGNISQRSSEIVGTTNGTLDTGEGPGSNDTTAPTISGTAPTATVVGNAVTITYSVTASGVTGDSTTTVGYIDYRTGDASFSSSGTLKASNNTSVTDGETITVVLSGLSDDTLYYYRIGAEDPSGNKGTDDNSAAGYTFTSGSSAAGGSLGLAEAPDTLAPTVISFTVTEITATTAKVTLLVNEDVTAKIKYGFEPGILTTEIIEEARTNKHETVISDLDPNTIYYVRGDATDKAGNEKRSEVVQFITTDVALLVEVPLDEEFLTEEGEEGEPIKTIIAPDVVTEQLAIELQFDVPLAVNENKEIKERVINRLKQDFEQVIQHVALGTLSQDPTSLTQFIEAASSELPGPTIVEGLPITEVTAESAGFSWKTDIQSNSLVAIVPDSLYNANAEDPYLLELGNSTEFETQHFVTITELRPATKYHYQIRSQGSLGPVAKSRDYEFQTLSEELAIIVTEVLEIEAARALVYWRTSVDADSRVEYTPLNENGEPLLEQTGTQGKTDRSTDHTVELRGLQSGTSYLLRVISSDGEGQEVDQFLSTIRTTRDNDAPTLGQINALSTLYPGEKPRVQTLITWRTDERANSQVIYWEGLREPKDKEEKVLTPVSPEYTRNHVVVLTGLTPGKVYQYKVKSVDETGNVSESESFTLLAPSSTESVIEVIADNFTDIFGWLKN